MRLFVAAELPPAVAAGVAVWAPRDEALRPVALEALHLTLAFLGERPSADGLADVLAPLARPVGGLSFGAEPLWLPARRPRVLALAVEDPSGALRALQAGVAEALRLAAGFEPGRRPYLPHVTVARVRRGGAAAAVAPGPPPGGSFAATALTLFRSHLGGRRAARYEALASTRLA